MRLRRYLAAISKDKCPADCPFNKRPWRNIKIAKILPPKEILGVLVSQDPTVRWSHFYTSSENESREEHRRKMLFASAIPYSLFDRVIQFKGKKITQREEALFHLLFQRVYWTHLHKCFTNGPKIEPKYKFKNARICANKWLTQELASAKKDGAKFVIALGNDAEKWISNKSNLPEGAELKIIKLPHPSGQNRKWNNRDDRDISDGIKNLLPQCRRAS